MRRLRLPLPLLVFAWLLFGCGAPTTAQTDALANHKATCESRGLSLAITLPCAQSVPALRELVATDPECRAYFADAGTTVHCVKDGGGE